MTSQQAIASLKAVVGDPDFSKLYARHTEVLEELALMIEEGVGFNDVEFFPETEEDENICKGCGAVIEDADDKFICFFETYCGECFRKDFA